MPLDPRDLALYLAPTELIDSTTPQVVALAADLRRDTPAETGRALFNWVRDTIRYDPLAAFDGRDLYRASLVIERRRGFCIQKAVALVALCRAAGIPSRLGFADVKNHQIPPGLFKLMGTNLFVFHGYAELFLDDRFVKVAPTFDPATARRANTLLVELDGTRDAMLQPVDPEGQPFIEYVRNRGSYADVPYDEIMDAFREAYGQRGQAAGR
jgi:transglutaminase-like putative cysteine protease